MLVDISVSTLYEISSPGSSTEPAMNGTAGLRAGGEKLSCAARANRLPGLLSISLLFVVMISSSCVSLHPKELTRELPSCFSYSWGGFRPIATDRAERFLGKVQEDTARCRGGEEAVAGRNE